MSRSDNRQRNHTAHTPVRIARSSADALADGTISRQSVTLHDPDTPCGIIDRDTSVTMPAEAVVDALAGRAVDVRGFTFCGGHLRDVPSSGGDR